MVTPAIQDYLKAIYKLEKSNAPVTTNAIAERMHVAQASVTGMVKKMAEHRLITHTPYRGVELTESGRKIALEMVRHHRLIELYLSAVMGYSWDRVHEEAEKLEHVISEEFEDKMADMLGHPATDPHGASIPSREGLMEEQDLVPLTNIPTGKKVQVKQISDHDPEKLRYLAGLGIYPDVVVEVLEKAPFDGPLLINTGEQQCHLGPGLTNYIFVERSLF